MYWIDQFLYHQDNALFFNELLALSLKSGALRTVNGRNPVTRPLGVSKRVEKPETSVDKQGAAVPVAADADTRTATLAPGFWRGRPLGQLSPDEWEALCDGCARCCLLKLEDATTGKVSYTNVRCRLLDPKTCRCTDYANRAARVPDCMTLTPDNVRDAGWLPRTCAYRLLATGDELPEWHPLVSGDPFSVVRAGISVAGRTVPEEAARNPEHYIVTWIR